MLLPYLENGRLEAGCDEAGRGCLAGAVFAAAVILPPDFKCEALNDSKQLSEKKRYELRPLIEREALAWAVGVVGPDEIDRINILRASFLAMHRAIDQLKIRPEHLLIDGNRFTPYEGIPHTTIVKGFVDRRKPFHALRGHSAYDNRQGRWKVSQHCRRFNPG